MEVTEVKGGLQVGAVEVGLQPTRPTPAQTRSTSAILHPNQIRVLSVLVAWPRVVTDSLPEEKGNAQIGVQQEARKLEAPTERSGAEITSWSGTVTGDPTVKEATPRTVRVIEVGLTTRTPTTLPTMT